MPENRKVTDYVNNSTQAWLIKYLQRQGPWVRGETAVWRVVQLPQDRSWNWAPTSHRCPRFGQSHCLCHTHRGPLIHPRDASKYNQPNFGESGSWLEVRPRGNYLIFARAYWNWAKTNSAWYSTSNKGRLSSYSWITLPGRVYHRSLQSTLDVQPVNTRMIKTISCFSYCQATWQLASFKLPQLLRHFEVQGGSMVSFI